MTYARFKNRVRIAWAVLRGHFLPPDHYFLMMEKDGNTMMVSSLSFEQMYQYAVFTSGYPAAYKQELRGPDGAVYILQVSWGNAS